MSAAHGPDGPRRAGGRARDGVLATLLAYELRMLLRDRRTLLIAVVAPLVLFPVILFVMRAVERADARRLEEATYAYAVTGSLADSARAWVDEALRLAEAERDSTEGAWRFEAAPLASSDAAVIDSLLDEGELQLVVRAVTAREADSVAAAEAAADTTDAGPDGVAEDALEDGAEPAPEVAPPDAPVLRVLFRSDSDLSRTAAGRMSEALEALRTDRRERIYRESGLPVDPDDVAAVEAENVASAEREGGALIGLILTPMLLFLMLSGGSIVASDAIAGEKERGTLETLLTTAATRTEIVRAKLLAVVAVGVVVALVNLANLLVYLVIGVVELPEGMALRPEPLALAVSLVLLLPLAVLIASVLLLLSGWSKSYKEFQLYLFPAIWVFLVPSLAGMLPGMELRSFVALVPIAGIGVAVREVMLGEYDWPFLAVAFASTAATAGALARLTGRALSTERLITRSDVDEAEARGGPSLFSRRVLVWFGVMWAALLLLSLWFGESLGIRGQVLVNILGIFLGGTLLMIKRYRLPVREALSLRPVPAAVWLAVLVGAPSALVLGMGVGELAQYVFPVPEQVIEAFGQFVLTEDIPFWQMLLLLAVLPGICEELAFRGVLLYGLRRFLRPVPLALVVGLVFGLFHIELFRILPVTYLGVLLSAVTILTGSIYPAMAWHTLNNAVALAPARLGWVQEGAGTTNAPLAYGLAAAGLAFALWILWRERVGGPRNRGRVR